MTRSRAVGRPAAARRRGAPRRAPAAPCCRRPPRRAPVASERRRVTAHAFITKWRASELKERTGIGESRRPTATPCTYSHRASRRLYLTSGQPRPSPRPAGTSRPKGHPKIDQRTSPASTPERPGRPGPKGVAGFVARHRPAPTGSVVPQGSPPIRIRSALTVAAAHGPAAEVLDVGRRTRPLSPALRRALAVRDRQCRFPGCGNRCCDAHHIEHWADGSRTALDNLVLLGRRHHRAVHEEGFRVTRDPVPT